MEREIDARTLTVGVDVAGLHVGVVGVGRMGALHARALRALDGVALVTVADADRTRAERVASELGVRVAETPEALLEGDINALVVATATPGHAPLLRLAARAGVPAFCEKPVAVDLPTMDAVLDEVGSAGILVQVGFQRRFDAGYRAAREAVRAGAIGRVLVVRAATHDPSPPPEEYIAASGGIFRDLHIHDFDAVRFVTGQEIVEVYADGAVLQARFVERYGDVDTAVATLRLSGGALSILSGARHDPRGYDARMEVLGTADSIAVGVNGRSPLRSVEPNPGRPAAPGYRDFIERFESAYRDELAAFVETVRRRSRSPCTLEEARAALVVALAADRSRVERRPVATEEFA